MTFTEKNLFFVFVASMGICLAGIVYCDQQINDPSQPAQLGSRLAVTPLDLERATPCAKEILQAQMRGGLDVRRHELAMTEWRCDMANGKGLEPSNG